MATREWLTAETICHSTEGHRYGVNDPFDELRINSGSDTCTGRTPVLAYGARECR